MKRELLIVGINGSPNKNGNTAFLLEKGLKAAAENGAATTMIHAAEALKYFTVPFCTACSTPCKGICAEGTPFAGILDEMRRADGLLIGSPVYFGTISGQLKAFADKIRCLRVGKNLLNSVGGAVAVGATRSGGQENTIRAIHEIMLVQGMTIVGPGHIEYDCGHFGAAALRPSSEDMFAQEKVEILARRITEVALATKDLRRRES